MIYEDTRLTRILHGVTRKFVCFKEAIKETSDQEMKIQSLCPHLSADENQLKSRCQQNISGASQSNCFSLGVGGFVIKCKKPK